MRCPVCVRNQPRREMHVFSSSVFGRLPRPESRHKSKNFSFSRIRSFSLGLWVRRVREGAHRHRGSRRRRAALLACARSAVVAPAPHHDHVRARRSRRRERERERRAIVRAERRGQVAAAGRACLSLHSLSSCVLSFAVARTRTCVARCAQRSGPLADWPCVAGGSAATRPVR